MRLHETIVINFPGGIISPGYLHDILEIAQDALVANVRFGSRQELLIDVPVKHFKTLCEACEARKIHFHADRNLAPNIVSTYPAAGILLSDSWLSEGVYKDIFDMFDYAPKVKINICDNGQTFVPFFTGHINWIASAQTHYWHLYVRLPKTNELYRFPRLIYTNDLVSVSRALEKILLEQTALFYDDIQAYGMLLYNFIQKTVVPITCAADNEPDLPPFHLPYYEGFNKYANSYWLGIYRRNELFPVSFLKEMCSVCLDLKIGELYATTWKSIIIKGISQADRRLFDYLLGKYRINVRHAANELNWQIEDESEDGLILKRHIIRYFDKEDVRTYGLCFAVKIKSASGIFGSVIIRRQNKKNSSRLKSQERFEILYTKNFNPNSSEYILFRDQVEKEHLGTYLVSLCKMFYESKTADKPLAEVNTAVDATREIDVVPNIIYQCRHCLTIYDDSTGDPENGVDAGTSFEDLVPGYCCPLCESPKEDFVVRNTPIALSFL